MWIDSHCHLDASEFAGQSLSLADQALAVGVSGILIPAVHRANFARVAALALQRPCLRFALGIHPMYVPQSDERDLVLLRQQIIQHLEDEQSQAQPSRLVAIGEIGLDFFIPALCDSPLREKQIFFYEAQLKMAREFDLPVLLHVRKSQDHILKYLRRIKVRGGIAHAFNGSSQQAQCFLDLGFKLGMGGAMTFTRALQIRRLATDLPLSGLVLETDAPDISPSWRHPDPNTPAEVVLIGQVLAELRGERVQTIAQQTTLNVQAVLPRWQR